MRFQSLMSVGLVLLTSCAWFREVDQSRPVPPPGFIALFNGRDLDGWKGLVGDPISRKGMAQEELAPAQAQADAEAHGHWRVENGVLVSDGAGPHLCTAKDYGDFELRVDWMIEPGGDSGIYLRGTPQVQIWDTFSGDPATQVGSGGLYNNQQSPSAPLVAADRSPGEWNTFRIRMIGERVSVWLNDRLVVDDVVLENYWDRSQPIFRSGAIELQTHGSKTRFRNIFLREIDADED